jgi:hypothetical protein
MASLEGWNFTIKLCPREAKLARAFSDAKLFFHYCPKGSVVGWSRQAILAISMLGA